MSKRIAVVGTGAVGGYIASHLAAASHDVIAIDGWPEHVEAMRSQGLRIVSMVASESFQTRIRAMHVTEVQSLAKGPAIDIAIVSVKSYDTTWATAMIAPYLAPDGYVVSAQNGINEERIASVVGWDRTIGCVVGNNFAVDLIEAGVVKRTMPRDPAVKSLELGEVHGRVTPRLTELAGIMKCVDSCSTTNNLWGVRWSKLCVNGMRNALSAVTGMNGNERDAHDQVRRVGIRLGSEAVRVGQALGYQLEFDGPHSGRPVRLGAGRPEHHGRDRGDADPRNQVLRAQQRPATLDGTGHAEGTAHRDRFPQRADRGERQAAGYANAHARAHRRRGAAGRARAASASARDRIGLVAGAVRAAVRIPPAGGRTPPRDPGSCWCAARANRWRY